MDGDGIHLKEGLAIDYALSELGHLIRDCWLDIFTDNRIVEWTMLVG